MGQHVYNYTIKGCGPLTKTLNKLKIMLDNAMFKFYYLNMNDIINELRIKLRHFLNERNMTLERAAILVNCSVGTLSLFLNEKTTPHERTLYRIRKLIGEVQ